MSPIPQTSFLVGTFFAASYSKTIIKSGVNSNRLSTHFVCSQGKEEFQKMMMMTLPTYAMLTTKSRII